MGSEGRRAASSESNCDEPGSLAAEAADTIDGDGVAVVSEAEAVMHSSVASALDGKVPRAGDRTTEGSSNRAKAATKSG